LWQCRTGSGAPSPTSDDKPDAGKSLLTIDGIRPVGTHPTAGAAAVKWNLRRVSER
jgi:hypothetical protein